MPNLFFPGQTDYIEKLNTLATTESVTDGSLAASFLSLVVAGLSTFGGGLQVNAQASAPATPASGFTVFSDASHIPGWKGQNGYLVKLNATANTADRTYTLPNASGTFALLGSAQTFSAAQTVSINSASAALTLTQAGAGAALSTNGQIVSTLGTGTAPFSVVSTTQVNNLNAQYLGGATFAAPGTIGGGTPGAATFTTLTATGGSTLTGSVGVGSAAFASTKVLLGGTAPAASTLSFGLYSGLTLDPAVTSSAYLNYTVPAIATGGTVETLAHYFVAQGTFTGAATNQYGFAVGSTMTGAANNYGFHSAIASGSGRYNFYAAGTAANVFVGQTSLAGAEGAEALRAIATSSAVNRGTITSAVTGSPPIWGVAGTDATISPNYRAQGSGVHRFYTDTGADGIIRAERTASTASFIDLIAFSGGTTLRSGGAYGIFFGTNGGTSQVEVVHVGAAVNRLQFGGGASGASPYVIAGGTDSNITTYYGAKNAGGHNFATGAGLIQFYVAHTASTVNGLQVTGAPTGGAITLSTFGTDSVRSVTLTAGGAGAINLGNGTNGTVASMGTFASAEKAIYILNTTTAPTANPATGGYLYCEGGALKYRGSSGTVTTIANA